MTQIGKETVGVFVKMQKGPTLGIENPEPLSTRIGRLSKFFDHIAKRREGSRIGVFHREEL